MVPNLSLLLHRFQPEIKASSITQLSSERRIYSSTKSLKKGLLFATLHLKQAPNQGLPKHNPEQNARSGPWHPIQALHE